MANKICAHACISCKKCEKVCPVGAITVPNNLAEIDYDKCISCGKCVPVCPHQVITDLRAARKGQQVWPEDAKAEIPGETLTEGRGENVKHGVDAGQS